MKYFAYTLIFLLSFQIVSAQVVITEIMYDVEGSDGGREWVEIYNDGSEDINLSSWSFYEAETNHKLKNENSTVINAGSYAIIADDAAQFQSEWSSVSVLILDSSFSLRSKNGIGEYIAIRDADKNDIDALTYTPQEAADGNGASLQKTNTGWIAETPTPGSSNLEAQPPSDDGEDDTEKDEQEQESPLPPVEIDGDSWPVEPQMFARVKSAPRIAMVGADVLLKGEVLGLKKEPLEGARCLWTFGDGGSKEGDSVLYHYNYPGKYVVILNASSGEYSASDRVYIEAIPADISIYSVGTGVDSFIGVQNNTKYELDLSWWRLYAGDKFFTIPKDTIILPKSKTIFPPQHTEFDIKTGDNVELLYPNGTIASSYTWMSNVQVAQPLQDTEPKATISETKDRSLFNVEVGPLSMPDTQKELEMVEKSDIKIIGENQSANIFTGASGNENGIYKWIFSVVGLSVISIAGVFLTKKESEINPLKSINTEADEYKIIEE